MRKAAPVLAVQRERLAAAIVSFEEAMFRLLQCGNGHLDGDDYGVPCESACRQLDISGWINQLVTLALCGFVDRGG